MKKIRPFDLIVVSLILVIICMLALFLREKDVGKKAEVYVGKNLYAVFNLDKEEEIKEIETKIGTVRLKVGNGKISVHSSPCRNKICMLRGEISHSHERIICLPTKMTIRIINDAEDSGLVRHSN